MERYIKKTFDKYVIIFNVKKFFTLRLIILFYSIMHVNKIKFNAK